jgi:hypothetical protein
MKLLHNPATGLLAIILPAGDVLNLGGIAETLGFPTDIQYVGAPGIAEPVNGTELPKLIIYKELFVHLGEVVQTSNEPPSTLLRVFPVKKEVCNTGRAESFASLQFKKLTAGTLSEMTIRVCDEKGHLVRLAYLSVVLKIRDG